MQADTKAGIGVGAGLLAASVLGQTRAFEAAEQAMNDQIEQDLDALGRTGQLPVVQPVLPLEFAPRSKVRMFVTSMAAGFLLFCVPTLVVGLATGLQDPDTTPAMAVLGAVFYGCALGIIFGWFPGLLTFAVRGHRENVRRTRGLVVSAYADYWWERAGAREALRNGTVEPVDVAYRLQEHHLDRYADI